MDTGKTSKRAYLRCKIHGDDAMILSFKSRPDIKREDVFICEHCMVELMSATFPTLLTGVKEKKDDVPVDAPDSP